MYPREADRHFDCLFYCPPGRDTSLALFISPSPSRYLIKKIGQLKSKDLPRTALSLRFSARLREFRAHPNHKNAPHHLRGWRRKGSVRGWAPILEVTTAFPEKVHNKEWGNGDESERLFGLANGGREASRRMRMDGDHYYSSNL